MSAHSNTPATVDGINRQLSNLEARARRESMLTLGIGLLSLALLAGYFTYAYQQFSEAMKPPQLVGLVQGMFEENLPQMRTTVEEQVVKSAPVWAADLSKKAVAAIPDGRKQLEKHILDQIDETVEQALSVSDEQLTAFLRSNKPLLEQEFAAIADDPEAAKQRIAKLEALMDQENGVPLKQQSEELFSVLLAMNDKLDRLQKGGTLGPEEQLEKRVLMLGRRLQLDAKSAKPDSEPSALAPAIEAILPAQRD